MQVTGLVVARGKRRMLIATPDFRFYRVPLPKDPPPLGGEVTVSLPSPWRSRIRMGLAALAGSAGAAALLLAGGPLAWAHPAEWVALDLHPAFLLQVSQKGKVLQVVPKDAAAKQVMQGLSLVGAPLATDIERLLRSSQKAGYLNMRKPAVVALAIHPLVKTPPAPLPQVQALVEQQIQALAPKKATLPVLQTTTANNQVWTDIAQGNYLGEMRKQRERELLKSIRQEIKSLDHPSTSSSQEGSASQTPTPVVPPSPVQTTPTPATVPPVPSPAPIAPVTPPYPRFPSRAELEHRHSLSWWRQWFKNYTRHSHPSSRSEGGDGQTQSSSGDS